MSHVSCSQRLPAAYPFESASTSSKRVNKISVAESVGWMQYMYCTKWYFYM